MKWRQRRKLGVTLRNLVKITKELKASGELEGLDSGEMSARILQEIIQDNPTAFGDPGFDFDSILELIEKFLPLIMMIMEMFSKF